MNRYPLRPLAALGAVLCLPLAGLASASDDEGGVHVRRVAADFDDIRFGIESAIENRGYVIDYHGEIGAMLDRTADDVGEGESPYRAAETWQFCSAVLSRRAMQADPVNIAFCPYVVFAYETGAEPGTVVVGFRTHEVDDDRAGGRSGEALEAVDRELVAIVDEAVD